MAIPHGGRRRAQAGGRESGVKRAASGPRYRGDLSGLGALGQFLDVFLRRPLEATTRGTGTACWPGTSSRQQTNGCPMTDFSLLARLPKNGPQDLTRTRVHTYTLVMFGRSERGRRSLEGAAKTERL